MFFLKNEKAVYSVKIAHKLMKVKILHANIYLKTNVGGDIMSKELGEKLKRLRENNGYTQQQIAEPLRIDRSTYSNYERGVSEPDFQMLSNIAKLFSVSPAQLLPMENVPMVADYSDVPMYMLSKQEKMLIARFRILGNEEKKKVLDYLASFLTRDE